jgi:hypothetical protein
MQPDAPLFRRFCGAIVQCLPQPERTPMRRTIAALFALTLLGGCVSILKAAWDDQAERDCATSRNPGACQARVEEIQRDRDR